ncbi:serine/threonine-protein phosphatase 2A activator [Strongylocentrotus purpuratus]|uniref:Serine/threonine-protein phosphatase 2A activator n=1 Tax=Strongylocentrotus purpuratus TaxID=7668 RepID=A0A7M7NQN2_STRPU|nr:serine/threonine-protein phosphatase 2A activator [Strongylocentrotus purpuratus]XP_030840259.1 serine/threonine-protein phosphatase 2A activator [Strongylocentrotus purpuratus]
MAESGQSPSAPLIPSDFMTPVKEVKVPEHMKKWLESQAYADYMFFVSALNDVAKGTKLTDECTMSTACEKVLALLEELLSWIAEIPPIDQPQRFGNKAYRTWHQKLQDNSTDLISKILPESLKGAVIELKPYLTDGFGNQTRIDYGTGHEMAFAAFLCCLCKLNVLVPSDSLALVNKVFVRYVDLTRKLQTTYNMEPAGSQGVWGLDDYQFLPFIWGSSQLIGHPRLTPKSIPQSETASGFADQYMFFGCVDFINRMKTGPFAEHSNVLWGISGVPHWQKVNQGLIKMYKAEVLSKCPVIQHFPFGSILSISPPS